MAEINDSGWSNVHEAAYRGYGKSVEKFIEKYPEHLELETSDEMHATPLLLACQGGHKDCVEMLINIGANISAKDRLSRGAVEWSALCGHLHILKYFAELNNPNLSVWRNLLALVISENDEDSLSAAKALDSLTMNITDTVNPFCSQVVDTGLVSTAIRVYRGPCGAPTRTSLTSALVNVTRFSAKAREQVLTCGILPVTSNMLKAQDYPALVAVCGTLTRQLLEIDPATFVDPCIQAGFLPNMILALRTASSSRPDVVVPLIDSLGLIAAFSVVHQGTVAQTIDLTAALSHHFAGHAVRDIYTALLICVTRLVVDNSENQCLIVNSPGIVNGILALTKMKNRDLQLAAVACLTSLGDGQPECQRKLAESGALVSLMQLLKKARADEIREQTVIALWSLAGSTMEERRSVATLIGVHLLVELLGSKSDVLLVRACQALETLCLGPHNKQGAIGATPGIWRLGRLIFTATDRPALMCSALRALRALLIGPGYQSHKRNQETLVDKRLLDLLVDYIVNSSEPIVRAESANTLAAAVLVRDSIGNPAATADNSTEKEKAEKANLKASSPRLAIVAIMSLLYSQDKDVAGLAGHSLATLAFNSLERQHAIDNAGLRIRPFAAFLRSQNVLTRIDAAFQVVVLSRMMPDADPASACAQAIHILAQILNTSSNSDELYSAADVVCRLLRLKSGMSRALVAAGLVDVLCGLMLSHADLVRGAAALALGHLTKLPLSCRQLLRRCMQDPFLVDVLQFYNDKKALSQDFIDAWHHARVIGLPPIAPGRLSLLNSEQGSLQLRAPNHPSVSPHDSRMEQVAIDNVAKANEVPHTANMPERKSSFDGADGDDDDDEDDNNEPIEVSDDEPEA